MIARGNDSWPTSLRIAVLLISSRRAASGISVRHFGMLLLTAPSGNKFVTLLRGHWWEIMRTELYWDWCQGLLISPCLLTSYCLWKIHRFLSQLPFLSYRDTRGQTPNTHNSIVHLFIDTPRWSISEPTLEGNSSTWATSLVSRKLKSARSLHCLPR